jgi:hypothetical protein
MLCLNYFDAELKSGFRPARHESPIVMMARHGPYNNQCVVPGPEHQPDVPAQLNPFFIHVVLGLGADGPSLPELGPAQPVGQI